MKLLFQDNNKNKGFTIMELMVVVAILSVLSIGIYDIYLSNIKVRSKQEEWSTIQSATMATANNIVRDIRLAGAGIDTTLNQPVFVHFSPYELAFNADLYSDRESIDPNLGGATVPLNPAIGNGVVPYAPTQQYTNAKAETIRWSLDSDNNGLMDSNDQLYAGVADYNPSTYKIHRQVFGSNGTDNGGYMEIIGEGIKGPHAFPDGKFPEPLFSIWIREDKDSSGEIEPGQGEMDVNGNGLADSYLWGDDGSNGGIANNGILEQGELKALYTGNSGMPKVVNATQTEITAINGDARLTGSVLPFTFQSELHNINKVDVNVLFETGKKYPEYLSSPHGPDYKFRDQTFKVSAVPRVYKTDTNDSPSLILSVNTQIIQCPYATLPQVTAYLNDGKGDPINGANVMFTTTMGSFSGSGKVTSTTQSTDVNGEALTNFYATGSSSGFATIAGEVDIMGQAYIGAATIELKSGPPDSIIASAAPPVIPADGFSVSKITGEVIDACGNLVDDNIFTTFSTSDGTLNPLFGLTKSGKLTTNLIASTNQNTAIVSLNIGVPGFPVITGNTNVDFTKCRLTIDPTLSAIKADGLSQTTLDVYLEDIDTGPISSAILFTITDGSINPLTATTGADGKITPKPVIISSTLPHTAEITAVVQNGICINSTATTWIVYDGCDIQITKSKANMGINDTTSITTRLTDPSNGNPIANMPVSFSEDLSLGTFNPVSGTTDVNGETTTIFTSGASSGVGMINANASCGFRKTDMPIKSCNFNLSSNPTLIPPDGVTTSNIAANITDSGTGLPKANESITFTTDLGFFQNSGTTSYTVLTDINGDATATLQAGFISGTANISAVAACASQNVQVNILSLSLTLDANPLSIDTNATSTLTATVYEDGIQTEPIDGSVVTFSFIIDPLSSTLSIPYQDVFPSGGAATTTMQAAAQTGTVTIEARMPSVTYGTDLVDTVDVTINTPALPDPTDYVVYVSHLNEGSGSGERLNFTIRNDRLENIRITRLQLTWDNNTLTLDEMDEKCGGGSVSSGTILNIDGCGKSILLNAGGPNKLFYRLRFSNDVSGLTITEVRFWFYVMDAGGNPTGPLLTLTIPPMTF